MNYDICRHEYIRLVVLGYDGKYNKYWAYCPICDKMWEWSNLKYNAQRIYECEEY